MTPAIPIRVLIVDDHVAIRIGLSSIVETQSELKVVQAASSGTEALEVLQTEEVDIVLLDLRMRGMNGLTFMQELRSRNHAAKILIISSYDTDEDVFKAVQAGANGYLLKDASEAELYSAIRAVHAGGKYFPLHIASRLAERLHREDLSTRELEVLQLISRGCTNKQIGNVLGISSNTVRSHVISIIRKLQVADRTEAATVAIRYGVIQNF